MIHRPNALQTTERLREISTEAQLDFPHIAIESDLEQFAVGCSSWHWHEYFEFALVSGGDMELQTQRSSRIIRAGEGYFVNANVLHLCRVVDGSARTRLHVHQFGRELLSGTGFIRQKYLLPLESCAGLESMHLRADDPRHAALMDALRAAYAQAEAEPEDWGLGVSLHLLAAWKGLYSLAQPLLQQPGPISSADGDRIKLMLAYIHSHYAEPIGVQNIARAAGICTRECFRCFQQSLSTTPTLYLMRFRVNAAARQLIDSDRSITEIAADCGFSSPSYFCKVFHDRIGRSPRAFRTQMRNEKAP